MTIDDIKKLEIPKTPGCYFMKDGKGETIYIGKAADLRSRVLSYWRESADHSPAKAEMVRRVRSVEWEETDSEIEALLLEANLVKRHQPRYNIDLRDDKRFAYIKVSTEDEVPGVFVTRRLDRSGRYFGPFTNMQAVYGTLKAIRRIWPYCTERKIGRKPCFYHQIGRCLGPCGGAVTVADYKHDVIEPIIAFLSGNKKNIIRKQKTENRKQEQRLKALEKKEATGDLTEQEMSEKDRIESEIRRINYLLINMSAVLAHANILGVAEKYAADVVELAKALALPRVPLRIEGYDISNIFGRDAVGAMVVFQNGEPDKGGYRKFKIRIGEGLANDTGMLKEVLGRRLAHREKTENRKQKTGRRLEIGNLKLGWPMPDLIVIDGGKGQLNAAVKEMKKAGLDIPVLAVSKGEGLRSAAAPDRIFFPGEKRPLELPLASPALHVVKRVRDEAHRFAISYHRELKRKRIYR